MPDPARVVGLYIAESTGAPMRSCHSLQLLPGVGAVGDRYTTGRGHWSDARWPDQELTLVESEVAEVLGIDPGLLRRNVVTRGVRLDDLIGVTFRMGRAQMTGVRRCDPCQYLDTFTRAGLARELGSRGGLRAHVLRGGRLWVGDRVTGGPAPQTPHATGSFWEVLVVAGRLGVTSFGGPVAHLGYFHNEYVLRRQWVDEHTYSDLVALCQFLPGPASSQVGMAIGIARAGLAGALAAWLGFTLPSALLLVGFAYGVQWLAPELTAGWLHGLKIVAVAVVAQALWGMGRALCPDRERATIAIAAAVAVLAWPVSVAQLLAIAVGGLVGWRLLQTSSELSPVTLPITYGRRLAAGHLALFFALLLILPIARQVLNSQPLALIDSFYRSGALVFGGGHVVLPLLQAEVVPPAWVTTERFLAGYGAAQAVPGPLFTFAAYLGAVMGPEPNGWAGATIALIAVFFPSYLLVVGTLPFWDAVRSRPPFRSALGGINAAVVGILLAALYNPLWTSAILGPLDFALGLVVSGLLMFWRIPPLVAVVLSATGGFLLTLL